MTSGSGQASGPWPPATAQPSTSAHVRPSASPTAMPEQALAGRVEPDDPSLAVDLDDEVGRAIDDGRQLAALPLERLAQPRAPERDGQLVAGELDDADAVRVGAATVGAPQAKQDAGEPRRTASPRGRPPAPGTIAGRPPAVVEHRRRARAVGIVADRCQQRELGTVGPPSHSAP